MAKGGVDIEPDHRMARIGVDHSCMSSDPIVLAETASQIADGDKKLRDVLQKALVFLLSHQYIEPEWLKGHVWHVQRGSGMGWRVSAPVADAELYVGGEKRWATLASGTAFW